MSGEHPRQRRQKVADFQRGRLLRAALAVAHQRGYEQMTVAAVIAEARMSRRTFYELFEDRDDCFLTLVDEALARMRADVRQACEGRGSWSERLRRGLAALLAFLECDREAGALVVSHLRGSGPRCSKQRTRALAALAEALDAGRSQAGPGSQPPSLAAEVLVGGALAVLDARLQRPRAPMTPMLNPLMSMIVLPYLGPAAAADEIRHPPQRRARRPPKTSGSPSRPRMRVTYRTARTLAAIAEAPGATNVEIAALAGVGDEGQASRLLARLARFGLIENTARDAARSASAPANAWRLTPAGIECEREISRSSGGAAR